MASQTEPIPELPPFLKSKGFSLIEKIGGGAFAAVYKASWTQMPNTVIAAKVISLTDETKAVWVQKCLKNEMKIIKSLNHPNVVRVYESIKTQRTAYIFIEFASNGSVGDILEKTKKPILETKAKKFLKDIVSGLAFCHSKEIAHRDIKPDNFLIDQNEKVMLSDFGFACKAITGAKLMKGTACGSPIYMAPEIKLKKEGEVYDAKASDVYALGISLFQMVYFVYPFDSSNEKTYALKQMKKQFKHITQNQNTSNPLRNLIDLMLDPNPKTRITAMGVSRHTWITGSVYSTSARSSN